MTSKPDATHPNAEAFPTGLSGPALRALAHAGLRSMAQLAQQTEASVASLHGMGPKGVRALKDALAKQGRRFRASPGGPPATGMTIPVRDGAHCRVVGGTHKGKAGTVRDIKTSKTGHITITVVQADGVRFKTLARNVVAGEP